MVAILIANRKSRIAIGAPEGHYKRSLQLYSPATHAALGSLIGMEQLVASKSTRRPRKPAKLTVSKVTNILWDSAWEAFVLGFLVVIFGTIAFRLVSTVWHDMTPALPPGLGSEPKLEAEGSPVDFSFFREHRYALIFLVLFCGITAGRLLKYSPSEDQRRAAAWAKRAFKRISDQWFGLIVLNAFVTVIAVMIIKFTQQFTLTAFLWHIVGDLVTSLLQAVAQLFSTDAVTYVKNLVAWYKANQPRLLFWLLYTAAICDDLGLPNYKTLGRFLWRRFFKSEQPTPAVAPVACSSKESNARQAPDDKV